MDKLELSIKMKLKGVKVNIKKFIMLPLKNNLNDIVSEVHDGHYLVYQQIILAYQ